MPHPGFRVQTFNHMTDYIHHVPGRLRIKTHLVKDRADNALRVRERIARVAGVQAVEANTLTGSIIVRYQPALATAETILAEFKALGLTSQTTLPPQTGRAPQLRRPVADQVANKLIETLIERTAIALIGALI